MENIIKGDMIPSINNAKGFWTFAIKSMIITPVTMPKIVGYIRNKIGIIPIIPTPNITIKYITVNTPIVTKSFIFNLFVFIKFYLLLLMKISLSTLLSVILRHGFCNHILI